MQQITDEQFEELIIRGEVDEEIFNKLTLNQQQELYNLNKSLYIKLARKAEKSTEITVEVFKNMTLSEQNELYLTNENLFIKLLEEQRQVLEGESELLNSRERYIRMLRQNGLPVTIVNELMQFKNDIRVTKNINYFDNAINRVLSRGKEYLKPMDIKQLKKVIMIEFNNQLKEKLYYLK